MKRMKAKDLPMGAMFTNDDGDGGVFIRIDMRDVGPEWKTAVAGLIIEQVHCKGAVKQWQVSPWGPSTTVIMFEEGDTLPC